MWPFSTKDKKPSRHEQMIAEFKAFRGIGDTFDYMGVTCMVVRYMVHRVRIGNIPKLVCDYVDNAGLIQQIEFGYTQLPLLIKLNTK